MTQLNLFKVRDLRKKDQYKIDDKYLNGYARIFGTTTTAVYNSLSRHAEFHTQEAFPSEELIAEEHGIGVKSVQRSIKRLVGANIITVERKKREGKWLNNNYFLIDKSEWKQPEDIKTLWKKKRKYTSPQDIKARFHRTLKPVSIGHYDPIKDNTYKDNTYKDIATSSVAGDIPKVIDFFKGVSPNSYNTWFGNLTERKACEKLLDKFPLDDLETLICELLPKLNILPYVGKDSKAFKPTELLRNIDKIRSKVLELQSKGRELGKRSTLII